MASFVDQLAGLLDDVGLPSELKTGLRTLLGIPAPNPKAKPASIDPDLERILAEEEALERRERTAAEHYNAGLPRIIEALEAKAQGLETQLGDVRTAIRELRSIARR